MESNQTAGYYVCFESVGALVGLLREWSATRKVADGAHLGTTRPFSDDSGGWMAPMPDAATQRAAELLRQRRRRRLEAAGHPYQTSQERDAASVATPAK
jgi:hypothetical protein